MRDKHAKRYQDTVDFNRRRTEERGRRMEEVKSATPFTGSELDTKMEEAQKKRIAGRDAYFMVELPESHALSWVHDVFDINGIFEEGRRLVEIEKERYDMRSAGHPHHIINERHPSGYDRLDLPNYKPSMIGDAFRRLGHRMQHGRDPDWYQSVSSQSGGRRLQEETHKSHARKLTDAFLGGTLAAPFGVHDDSNVMHPRLLTSWLCIVAFADVILPIGKRIRASDESLWEATIRYLVFGTIGCVLPLLPNRNRLSLSAFVTDIGATLFVQIPLRATHRQQPSPRASQTVKATTLRQTY